MVFFHAYLLVQSQLTFHFIKIKIKTILDTLEEIDMNATGIINASIVIVSILRSQSVCDPFQAFRGTSNDLMADI
jgi:hypothetical protein